MNKALALLVLAFIAAAPVGPGAAPLERKDATGARPAKPVAALKGAAIQAQIVGNTISGTTSDKTYFEYVAPDGTIRGSDNSGFYSGVWQIQGDQLCLHYDEDDGDNKPWDCRWITLVDDTISWSSGADDDKDAEAKLIAGNPLGL
ncbi:MAG: hypothetical protein E7774_05780 [Bradyrhizobium sp.]|nr:MAG: hypothetical protein E7774_05780 [Bradyrhizobium sp.]